MKLKDEKLVFKIIKSSYLTSLYFYILNNKNFMQNNLKTDVPILKYDSHISSSIKFFRENNLITCKNPKDANYKMYESTNKIELLKEEIKKYMK